MSDEKNQPVNVQIFPVMDVAMPEGKKVCPFAGATLIPSQAEIPGLNAGLAVPVSQKAKQQPVLLSYRNTCVEAQCPLWVQEGNVGYCSQNPVAVKEMGK